VQHVALYCVPCSLQHALVQRAVVQRAVVQRAVVQRAVVQRAVGQREVVQRAAVQRTQVQRGVAQNAVSLGERGGLVLLPSPNDGYRHSQHLHHPRQDLFRATFRWRPFRISGGSVTFAWMLLWLREADTRTTTSGRCSTSWMHSGLRTIPR
jgi:hypothetical protein